MLRTDLAPTIYLKNYRAPDYLVKTVELDVQLHPSETIVVAVVTFERNKNTKPGTPLKLDGDELQLVSLEIDGSPLSDGAYRVSPEELVVPSPPQTKSFQTRITTRINPTANTKLMGLYRSSGNYCTQCEAEGFRRITYFPDRPDVLAVYTTRIEADKKEAPVLLGNGNPVKKGSAGNGRHYAIWHDPHPKPSYLFALVAGDLGSIHKPFKTMSGRKVKLGIYVEKGKEDKAHYAMDALIRSMRWDEEVFGCEYDLDIFNIVAVSDFNMGAMENKGLNIFNDKYVLADPKTATDQDFQNIEAIIAHEYFHNWTGNRITCRDWFQLCLKEGLTVFRDQEFSSDQRSRGVKRVSDVRLLKASQFPEDAGPLAHPVRPERYREINNFYTATVYEKGSEIVRMLKTMLGEKTFMRGIRRYLKKHDGEAATIEDFLACFEFVAKRDLSRFALWYSQGGTPTLSIESQYDPIENRLTLEIEQTLAPTPGQARKKPMQMPLRIGLVGRDGQDMVPKSISGAEHHGDVIILEKRQHKLVFNGIAEKPVLSINRGFSAPVNCKFSQSKSDLALLALNDSDEFNRWRSFQELICDDLKKATRAFGQGKKPAFSSQMLEAAYAIAVNEELQPAFRALALSIPSEGEIGQLIGRNVDPQAIYRARVSCMKAIGEKLEPVRKELLVTLKGSDRYSPGAEEAGKRSLRNLLLVFAVASGAKGAEAELLRHFRTADNMTDEYAALQMILAFMGKSDEAEKALKKFYRKYKSDHLVIDKWFTLQALQAGPGAPTRVRALMNHSDFSLKVPNRVRSLIGVFASGNLSGFGAASGSGFRLVADVVARLDDMNPQVAARMLTAFRSYRNFEPERRAKAEAALKSIRNKAKLSPDVSDILDRTLAG